MFVRVIRLWDQAHAKWKFLKVNFVSFPPFHCNIQFVRSSSNTLYQAVNSKGKKIA